MKTLFIVLNLFAGVAFAHPGYDSNLCAVAYQGPHYTGEALTIRSGSFVNTLSNKYMRTEAGTWNNRISSLRVARGCQLVGYQYDNYGRHYRTGERIGQMGVWNQGHYPYLGYMDELVSSLTCTCL